MTTTNYKKWNTILGWLSFAIALVTYTLTLEPSVSYWDCGEYIATAAKLEVGHPPGAPLFQMLGAFFAMFTSETTQIAKMVNFMSALASAFTILFMFWSITALVKKIATHTSSKISEATKIAILGSGLVGALAYTFTDSFWFSAVEAEVYAMASFLMALLFWLALRWEEEMHLPQGNKWLLLISYVVGLSFGVHILSLLVIPAIVFIYIFKNYKQLNTKQFIIANIISVLVLAFIFKMLFPFTLRFFSASELFFVNTIGLPFNSGSIIAGLVLIGLFYFGINYTRKNQKILANTLILCVLFVMIGFSSWIMLPIRANANTTINENNPSSARELLAYANREQYGDSNVFYDTYYSITYNREQDKNNPTKDEKPKYEKDKKAGKYVIVNDYKDALSNYSSRHKGFIPRMVSTSEANIKNYKAIAGIPQKSKRRPTFIENIRFMFKYQFGYMYVRYFMWNFVGRQNDIQGELGLFDGNWLSGITFIDQLHLGPQNNLPIDMKENKGRNTYYFLPLILGIIGLLFHLKRDPKTWYTLFIFFVFTGLAIIFYTNPKPFEPRERDYAVVGSFYIFAIWIGFGVYAIFDYLKNLVSAKTIAIATTLIALFAVPTLMAFENWDDHDRSNRYTAKMNANAYLDSCDKDAIMFTIGDNDTFPLWYLQEIENHRTDIKLINTSLFATGWYIDQMKRKTYKADPIPSQLKHDDYKYGSLEVAYHIPDLYSSKLKDSVMLIKDFMRWMQSKNEATFYDLDEDGKPEKVFPTNRIRIPVDKVAVLKSGLVKQKDAHLIVPYIDIKIDQGIQKNRILMLDILANNNWKHPIYFTGGANADDEYLWLKDYLQLDGVSYKFVPIYHKDGGFLEMGRIDTDLMYNRMKNFNWDALTAKNIYLGTETKNNTVIYRNNFIRLSEAFQKENDTVKAIEVLDYSIKKLPINTFGHYGMSIGYIENYYKLKKVEKARTVANQLIVKLKDHLDYLSQFNDSYLEVIFDDIERYLLMYDNIVRTTVEYDTETYSEKTKNEYIKTIKLYKNLMEQ